MAVTHKAIAAMFYRRVHGIDSLSKRYGLSTEYVEDALRHAIWGRKITARKKNNRKPKQMSIAEVYGEIEIR